ncbi:MAG TPA: di-heme oxidoredictase family protein [Casimicrobiaceae bacterium]|nr:di-heme oxidoredictase family protein [Casimicrobiaceae bacterium]
MISRTRICMALAAAALCSVGNSVWTAELSSQHRSNPPSAPNPPQTPPPSSPPPTAFGDPLPGLSSTLSAAFAAGLETFQEVDTPASGLGPIFNNVSCVACHSTPAPGGGSTILETRFGRLANGQFDPLTELGGSLLQQQAIDPHVQEVIPPEANVIAHRITTPLFGAGLIEAIPDAEILLVALQRRPDGISGRLSLVTDVASGRTRVGRFGWKAQHATLLSFAGDAYLNEMGITNRLFPTENAPNGNTALVAQYDTVADPEDVTDPTTGKADIDMFADFMRMLAPPPTLPLSSDGKAGKSLFSQIGCSNCHVPSMVTGRSNIPAFNVQPVALYSDLLLHDMGSLGDGIGQGVAAPGEMKTAPLWGLRARTAYLHDGRATTVDAAITLHDGEAAAARSRYTGLSATQKQQLLEFLGSI